MTTYDYILAQRRKLLDRQQALSRSALSEASGPEAKRTVFGESSKFGGTAFSRGGLQNASNPVAVTSENGARTDGTSTSHLDDEVRVMK